MYGVASSVKIQFYLVSPNYSFNRQPLLIRSIFSTLFYLQIPLFSTINFNGTTNYIKYYTKYSKVLLTKAAFSRHNPKAGVASKKKRAFLKFYIQEEDSIFLIYF